MKQLMYGGENIQECYQTASLANCYNVSPMLSFLDSKHNTGVNRRTFEEVLFMLSWAAKTEGPALVYLQLTTLFGQEQLLSYPNDGSAKIMIHRIMEQLLAYARLYGAKLVIGGEIPVLSPSLDLLCTQLMRTYNRNGVLVYQTLQMYSPTGLERLANLTLQAQTEGYLLGLSLVRGAYHRQEIESARFFKIEPVVYQQKKQTDIDYDTAVRFALENIDDIALVCATGNEQSIELLTQGMVELGIAPNDVRIIIGQYFGLDDVLSFGLAKAGYRVVKLMRYGALHENAMSLLHKFDEDSSFYEHLLNDTELIAKEQEARSEKRLAEKNKA